MCDAVGLDFGQSECRLAYYANGQPVALPQVTRLSQIWLSHSNQRKVPRTSDEVRSGIKDIAFDLKSALSDARPIPLGRHHVAPVDLAAMVMRAVREEGEKRLGPPLRRAMVVTSAHAGEPQRAATRTAAQAAGFSETKLISETLAAAIFARNTRGGDGWYLVYHLGAGPFEAAVIRVEGQQYKAASVVGNREVRGRDLDQTIAARIVEQARQYGWSWPDAQKARAVLLRLAEAIKIELATKSQWRTTLPPDLAQPPAGRPAELELVIKRAEVDQWLRPQIDLTFQLVRQALAEAQVAETDLKVILTVGSTAVLPLVDWLCMEAFDHAPMPLDAYAVARGAAIHAQTIPAAQWEAAAIPPPTRPASTTRQPALQTKTIPSNRARQHRRR